MARIVAIVNPAAGRAPGEKLRARAAEELKRLFPEIAFLTTAEPGHAIELAREASDAELVIAVGGDGTVREVASGLVSATGPLDSLNPRPLPVLAVVPVGSGNDFLKTLGIPADVVSACRIAKEGKARPVDMMRVEMMGEAGMRQLCFINAAGFGFDASVAGAARRYKFLRGLPLYLFAVLDAIRSYECPVARIKAQDFAREQSVLLIAAANGRFYGGGMKVAPEALPDDGLIEVCIGDGMGRLSIMRKLPRFVAGTHVTLKEVTMLRTPELELEFRQPVPVQLDGDLLEPQPFSRFRLTALPRAINIRVA
ncbi:diacylglycerol kinase family lipid kinase [candidate division WOR-3 bacterium]|uniref:Diacylglycerol kinase family lipid kinase n=1 Tax=candidate division WOR-3 bacterium TaxID=2052148 RepID=A0A937XD20_UNCW3|nr:diacylglycerol kinase family lipid kinase [candidate division WOR-3 bacterium]